MKLSQQSSRIHSQVANGNWQVARAKGHEVNNFISALSPWLWANFKIEHHSPAYEVVPAWLTIPT